MNPKVAELLEGKSDDEKFQAIAFSLACLLTRPTANSPPDAPMKDERRAKEKSRSEPKYSFEELSDEEDGSEWGTNDQCSLQEIDCFFDDLFCTTSDKELRSLMNDFSFNACYVGSTAHANNSFTKTVVKPFNVESLNKHRMQWIVKFVCLCFLVKSLVKLRIVKFVFLHRPIFFFIYSVRFFYCDQYVFQTERSTSAFPDTVVCTSVEWMCTKTCRNWNRVFTLHVFVRIIRLRH